MGVYTPLVGDDKIQWMNQGLDVPPIFIDPHSTITNEINKKSTIHQSQNKVLNWNLNKNWVDNLPNKTIIEKKYKNQTPLHTNHQKSRD